MVIPEYVTPAVAYILLYMPLTCCSMGYTVPCEFELKLLRRLKDITRIVENIPKTVLGFHPFVTNKTLYDAAAFKFPLSCSDFIYISSLHGEWSLNRKCV